MLSIAFSLFPVPVTKERELTFVTPFMLAVIVMNGPTAGVLTTGIAILVYEVAHRKPWEKAIFNTGAFVLQAVAAGVIFDLLGQRPGVELSSGVAAILLIMATTVSAVNIISLLGLFYVLDPQLAKSQLRPTVALALQQFPIEGLIAVLFLSVFQTIGRPGLALMVVLLVLFRYGSQAYLQLQSSFEEVQSMLISILDGRDAYTAGHSQRVSDNAAAIAKELGLPASEVGNIRRAGLLHDIGKVNVPDEVLKKPGKLSQEETDVMNRHPADGARFVEGVSSLKHLSPIIRHHHERYDGQGYPDGLAGESIPLGARILLVADAFDAMTTDRPYRAAMSKAEALGRIIANAGTQFDARVAIAALRVLGKDLAESTQLEAAAEAAATRQDKVSEASE